MPSSAPSSLRWTISQIGSREHYTCPVAFQRRATLRRLYTDIWCPRFRSSLQRLPRPFWTLARRFHAELPRDKVVSFSVGGIRREMASRKQKTTTGRYTQYLENGIWFGRKVAAHMAACSHDPHVDVHLAFSTGGAESLAFSRENGLLALLDQLDPAQVDEQMIAEEMERWPGWEALPGAIPVAFYERLQKEWSLADAIIVNSEFSRRAIHQQGVPFEKIHVVPLSYEPEPIAQPPAKKTDTFTVLWLGQINLRKGIPYFFEAARILAKENIQFNVAGRVGISEQALKSAPPNVSILGHVPREQALGLFSSADVFVLPTISDGFALTQLEAMARGLPLIVTPNCGDVVTSGVDGIIIPIRDPQALAAAILSLKNDRQRLQWMSENAIKKSRQFTIDRYANELEAVAHAVKRSRSGEKLVSQGAN